MVDAGAILVKNEAIQKALTIWFISPTLLFFFLRAQEEFFHCAAMASSASSRASLLFHTP